MGYKYETPCSHKHQHKLIISLPSSQMTKYIVKATTLLRNMLRSYVYVYVMHDTLTLKYIKSGERKRIQ